MSRAGCPYDNAPMERYFNTLKNELINHYYYKTEKEIYESIEEFAYVWYNHVRPHSYNDYMTPYEKRRSFIIDMGPGGGIAGGRIIATGTPQDIKNNPDSLTGKFI